MDRENWCRHYRAIAWNDTCEVGVAFSSIKSVDANGKLPYHCVNPDASVKCLKHEGYSVEEIEAEQKFLANFLSSLNAFWTRETEVCPHCGEHAESCEQIGRCVYARPCGCRVGQGRLHKNWR